MKTSTICEVDLWSLAATVLALCLCAFLLCAGCISTDSHLAREVGVPQRPVIMKKGTIDLDLCETTPFVFHGRVYRLEWFRNGAYLRIMDHDTRKEVSRFGSNYRFPCAYVENGTVYVVGTKTTDRWTGDILTMFISKDLKHWDEREIFNSHGDYFCNTSLCKAGGRYVMSYEQNRGGFHAQFLESEDLLHWTALPMEQQYHPARYCAPHCLRWHDGWFYLLYLEADKPHGYEQYITRSRDLIHWEPSPLNPVLAASPEDKQIDSSRLTQEQRDHIAKAVDVNNSDIDFCDFKGKLIINYSWGNQTGVEFLAEAEYAGSTAQFLESWFPNLSANSRGVHPLEKARPNSP